MPIWDDSTRITPGALVRTCHVYDCLYTSIYHDNLEGVDDTRLTDEFSNELCFVVAVLGRHAIHYRRAYVVSSDMIGWVLLSEEEVILDSPRQH